MTQDLESRLLDSLERDGPIDVVVHESEYKNYLVLQMKRLWLDPLYWRKRDYQKLLLFFRGYSFFRELGENEREFWANFHREIGYTNGLTNAHRDALEKALKSDERTKSLFIESDRREFVKTIDAIWGVRSLNARTLEKLFRRYYFRTTENTVNEELITRLLPDEPSEVSTRAARQAVSYNRIFSGLRQAIRFVLNRKIEPEPLDTLSQRLRALGHEFTDPNPIEFFINKAEAGLGRLFDTLRGEIKQKIPTKKRISYQSEFDTDEPDVGQRQKRSELFFVDIEYPLDTFEHGDLVTLEFKGIPQGQRRLELSGITAKSLEFKGNSISFYLETGTTTAQLFVDNEPAAPVKHLVSLPELEWTFFDHRSEALKFRPIEGRALIAEVRLADGRFARQRWKAMWDATGQTPLGFPLEIALDEYTIFVTLEVEPQAMRFIGTNGLSLAVLENKQVEFRFLPEATTAQHRVLYASQPNQLVPLEAWHTLHPELEDELIVERQVRKDWWEAVGKIPVRLLPVIHECKLYGRTLELFAFAPLGAVWQIQEADGIVHEYQVLPTHMQINLQNRNIWKQQTITITLHCGEYRWEKQLEYIPNMQEWLESELPFGLGWGSVAL